MSSDTTAPGQATATRDKPSAHTPYFPHSPGATFGGKAPAGYDGSSQAWLLTFADLTALLITFFVMLFAMSQVEQRKWQNLVNALANRLDLVREVEVAIPRQTLNIDSIQALPGSNLDYLNALLEHHLAAEPQLGEAMLQRRSDRLVISLPGPLLFPSGVADLDPEGARVVSALSALLSNLSNRIEVTGSADPVRPISTFVTNWELSLVRAARVASLLTEAGYQRPIILRGLGDSRFAKLAPELSLEQREALARRVDIAVLEDAREVRQ
ncbi:MAG: flagellar motor protein MotB [Kiloniellales bacterium]